MRGRCRSLSPTRRKTCWASLHLSFIIINFSKDIRNSKKPNSPENMGKHIVNTYNLLVVIFVALGTLATAYGLAIIGSTVGQPSCISSSLPPVPSQIMLTTLHSLHLLRPRASRNSRLCPHNQHHRRSERTKLSWGHCRMSFQRLVWRLCRKETNDRDWMWDLDCWRSAVCRIGEHCHVLCW
jgi:hypothetical protein